MIYKASKCEWPWIWPLKVAIDVWRSLKVKCDDVIGLSLYAFLLMFNSNMWPNSAPLQDIRLWNLSDLEFDLWRSLKVKYDSVIGISIYALLLIYIVIACLSLIAVITTRNAFSSLLSLGPNYEKSKVHRMTSKWPWTLKGQRYPYLLNYYTIARFPDNWVFSGFNGEFEIFEKQMVKNWKLKISEIPNAVCNF